MNQLFTQTLQSDTFISKDDEKVEFFFIQHASFYINYKGLTIYIDPVTYEGIDYSLLPKADLILITHDHYDHLDKKAVANMLSPKTVIYGNKYVCVVFKEAIELRNDEKTTFKNIEIEAVPAYNTTEGRDIYHPKGRDNGYIITLGGSRIYIPGDCEDMPEMKNFKDIDVAFLPINQPYTMTIAQAINAAKILKPKILYPIHYSDTDLTGLSVLKKDKIEVRIFKM